MRILLLVLAGIPLLLRGSVANGAVVTISVQGQVTGVDDDYNLLGGAVKAGDSISATYRYESMTTDSNSNSKVGDYWQSTAPFGISASAGGLTMQTNPGNSSFLVEICDGASNRDNYLLRSYSNVSNLSAMLTDSHVSWQLDDDTQTAFSSDALPVVPPDLTTFLNGNAFHLSGTAQDSGSFDVSGVINSVILGELSGPVPEPSTLAIWSVLGGLGVGLAWRRKRMVRSAQV